MKLNTDQCHLLVSQTKYEYGWAKTADDKIWDSNEVILLGQAITYIRCSANQNLTVLRRLAKLIT